ncbi:MAG: Piwi domain-containing protein [Prolixibacteraceae bacterium]|nr:Piwi domain-containing protein [Prolixibacteraceae bacterium]
MKGNKEQLQKFTSWLSRNQEICLFEIDPDGFSTFFPMREEMTWQYESAKSKEISAPFINTQQLSAYIGVLMRTTLSEKYERFLNQNTFVTECIELIPFRLKKCFEFNVEVFEDGHFLVHFLPVSKITGSQSASVGYIRELKRTFSKEVNDLTITVVDLKTFRRQRINIFSLEDMKLLEEFLKDCEDSIITFDYHFLASYSPSIFREIAKNTIKDIDGSIFYLEKIISSVTFPDWFNFQSKPFARVDIEEFGTLANLKIGENKCVNKQSAAYYSGILKPAGNCAIQPVLIGHYQDISQFTELIQRFNKGAIDFTILNPLKLQSDVNPDLTRILEQKKEMPEKNFLVCIFTYHPLSSDFLSPLNNKNLRYQIYQGVTDKFKLSNFAVKSLEKLGGILCAINQTYENKDTYFIGIDLGHSPDKDERFSNLCVAFFNNNGILLKHHVNRKIKKNESITAESILPAFSAFRTYLQKQNKPMPEKLIIHRDGKLHVRDIENMVSQAKEQLSTDHLDIIEVVKHGYPVVAGFEKKDGAYCNLNSGSCWIDNSNKYAILVTNIQSDEKNAIVNPLIIKHRYGKTEFSQLLSQIYWFTKIYTNNLYNSTRLPATTQKANNLVGTGRKKHQATYIG